MVSISTVWDRTTEFLGDNLAALVPIALLTVFVPTSLQENLNQLAVTATPGVKIGLGLAQVPLWLLALWGQLAITAMVIDTLRAGARPAAVATQRLLPAIGVLFVAGLLVLALLLPALIVLTAFGFTLTSLADLATATLPETAKGPAALALLIAVPVMIWLIARIYVLLTAVVVAERRGVRAIVRAFVLSRGLALRIVGVMILYAIVAGVATLAARTVFGSIFALLAGGEGSLSLARILTSVIAGAVSAGFTVLATVFCAKLYLATTGQDDPTPP